MNRLSSSLAGLTALVALVALVLQAGLIVQTMRDGGASTGAALWRFFGFFTILTNIFVTIVASGMALGRGGMATPRIKLCALTAIVVVGVVYSLALRSTWNPTGWQAVADHALHDAAPLLFVAAWLTGAHGALVWRDIGVALVFPFAYFVYAIARGMADGWYAYWFLNPAELGWGGMAVSVVVLLCAFALIAALGVALDRVLGRARRSGA